MILPERLHVWVLAARPKTLWAAVAPVVMGAAMAGAHGAFHGPAAVCALVGAALIQVGTNFANDYFDYAKGTDTTERIGPVRVTQAGLIAPEVMRRATALTFGLVFIPGLYLVWRGGWPLLVIGVVSILMGVLYTAGPYPLGYLGLGDALVLIFFGPVAVGGTYYAQALDLDPTVLAAGLGPGLLSVAILTVNNLRDLDGDRRAGKRTLAVRFGRGFARGEYCFAVMGATVALPAALAVADSGHRAVLIAALAPAFALPTLRTVLTRTDGPSLNGALAGTGRLLLVYSVLFSLGWLA